MRTLKSQMLKKAIFPLFLLAVVPFTPACEPRDVAIGAAGVAVGAIIVDAIHDNDCHTETYYVRERICREDYWGHTRCRWHRVKKTRCVHYYSLAGLSPAEVVTNIENLPLDEILEPTMLAKRYRLSVESAERFFDALKQAQQGQLDGILELGLTEDDMQSLAKLRLPADESIDRMARNLDQLPILTKGMLSRMIVFAYKLRDEECDKLEKNSNHMRREYHHYCVNR